MGDPDTPQFPDERSAPGSLYRVVTWRRPDRAYDKFRVERGPWHPDRAKAQAWASEFRAQGFYHRVFVETR